MGSILPARLLIPDPVPCWQDVARTCVCGYFYDGERVCRERVESARAACVIILQMLSICRATRVVTAAVAPPPGIWASVPLIPGLSDSPSQNPHYHPPSDGASAPFGADENGVGYSHFLSFPGCLSASSHQPCLLCDVVGYGWRQPSAVSIFTRH